VIAGRTKTTGRRRSAAARVVALGLAGILLLWAAPAHAQKFYPDDPLWKEPPPEDVVDPQPVALSGLLEFFTNQFTRPGQRQPEQGVIEAQNANTVGGVPDSPWFTNRHGRVRMPLDELVAGPGNSDPPRQDRPWRVLTVKPYGDRTGILMVDADDTLYLLRFDPKDHIELMTGASLIGTKLYWAAGYNTLENYLVYFDRDDLEIHPGAEQVDSFGQLRDLLPDEIDEFLAEVARDPERGYRAVATRAPRTSILGNYQFYGTRSDDINDVVPHEHRRDLRGMWVLNAWVNNYGFTPANTLEAVVTGDGVQYIRRFVVDFFKILGAGEHGPKEARDGNDYRFQFSTAVKNIAGMGVTRPEWATEAYPRVRGLGRFGGGASFDADTWVADTHFVTWANRLPDDLYWGAKLVMSFTDEEIRAIVNTGGYTDERTTLWIADALIARRDEIGRDFFAKVLPLDNFRVVNGRLEFDDLMATYGLGAAHAVDFSWHAFDNDSELTTMISYDEADGTALPPDAVAADVGEYFLAQIGSIDTPGMNVLVYLRKEGPDVFKVVGVERNWPGKLVVEPETEVRAGVSFSRYASLDDRRRALLDAPAQTYNEVTGRDLSAQEWFDTILSLSERTTFDAVTNALVSTRLTDENGESLGDALDLIGSVERIAGQYSGRGGDQQFRIYVNLVPNAEDVLQRSTQFHFGHLNTVYHVGYPRSYRQEGDVPNMQFSVSEDGTRGDIDVDYRSSKSPQALFNGHLTSANSDVRAGNNYDRHTNRWTGLVNWWQDIFGQIEARGASTRELFTRATAELATPLPPDRSLGAAPETLSDAAQEFLTDWLVRGQVDEAMQFFSRRAIACINIDEGSDQELLSVEDAIIEMREIMREALDVLPDRDNLTEAIDAVPAQSEDQAERIETHPFAGDFAIIQVSNAVAADYTCSTRRGMDAPEMPGGPDALGTYWGVLFRFKAQDDMGGVLGLLWDRLEGSWKISSYAIIEQ